MADYVRWSYKASHLFAVVLLLFEATSDISVQIFHILCTKNMERCLQTSTFCNKCMRTLSCDSNLWTLTSFSLLVSFTKQKVAVCKPYLSPYCHPLTDPFRLLNPLWNTWWLKSLAPPPPPHHPLLFTVSCYMSHIVHCGANCLLKPEFGAVIMEHMGRVWVRKVWKPYCTVVLASHCHWRQV